LVFVRAVKKDPAREVLLNEEKRGAVMFSLRQTETPLSRTVLYINERHRENHVYSQLSSPPQKHDNLAVFWVFLLFIKLEQRMLGW